MEPEVFPTNEIVMPPQLSELINLAQIQSLLDGFCGSVGIAAAIVDHDNQVLLASHWQRACRDFHRRNPDALRQCAQTGLDLACRLKNNNKYAMGCCLNGLIDTVTPIRLETTCLAVLYVGQFLLEEPDREYFRRQAERFGFDQDDYWTAVRALPIIPRERLETIRNFSISFAEMLSDLALQHFRAQQAGETIKRNEDRFRRLADNSPDMIFRMSLPDGRLEYVSPAAETISGYRPDEFLDRPEMIQQVIHPDLSECFSRTWQNLLSGDVLPTYEYKVVHKSGATRWVYQRSVLICDSQGNPSAIEGTVTDISQRKRAEQALAESEERFRETVELLPTAVCEYDLNGRLIYANKFGLEAFGYNGDDLERGLSLQELLSPGEIDRFKARMKMLRDGDEHGVHEYSLLRKDGTVIEVLAVSSTIRKDGRIMGVRSCLTPITEQKKAEKALRSSEQKYRELANSLPQIVFESDREGNLTFVNRIALNIFGYEKDDVELGANVLQMVIPEDRERVRDNIARAMQGQAMAGIEYTALKKNGETFPVIVHSNRIIHDDVIKGMRGIIFDITERKKAEEDKEKMQVRAQQAQKMEAVGTLAGGIAHDFNNLLQAITGYSDLLLLRKQETHPDYKFLRGIQKAGERAGQLVQQLLIFSRRMDTEKSPLDLNRELEQTINILERTIPKMIEIRFSRVEDLWTVNANNVQIEQMLLNLGSNAADAMPDGGVLTLQVRNTVLEDHYLQGHPGAVPGNYVMLSISDTGHGMDRETVEHIFEPFYTTKEIGKGTGLGLASVYGIVKAHNGVVNCYSEVGVGTTFRIYLPATEPAGVGAAGRSAVDSPLIGGTETLLIVDDEDSIRDVATQILEQFGYRVLVAANGEEALKVFKNQGHHIDLIILDIGMPGMGGHKCLTEILTLEPAAKVLLASGYSLDDRLSRTIESGAGGFIPKPYQISELLDSVRQALDG